MFMILDALKALIIFIVKISVTLYTMTMLFLAKMTSETKEAATQIPSWKEDLAAQIHAQRTSAARSANEKFANWNTPTAE